MTTSVWLAFLVAAVLISISPGAGAVNTMSSGLRYGVRNSLPAILGLQLGYGAQILLVGLGLGAIMASSAWALVVIKWLGVAYLVWLGWKKWHEKPVTSGDTENASEAASRRFWQSALVNLTNPKATVFLVALFPQFLHAGEAHGEQLAIMGLTLIVVDCVVMLGYALLASQLFRWMTTPEKQQLMNRVFGSLFVAAAVALASFRRA
ncbi:homoserine/homoserine lactone efflux protein [Marinobacter xestospongiae]|uniref:Homoserine/homoserine lactone efflux protein n=1 Tax=Marinobacter xestospongiae TaxID=994319 RepID=A0ABU3W0F6_9GAMM|nr:homoserine/homoserine lactone efflux protein [Marinobacter xestospongiae]MCK7567901.1 homoserine/homoserine lactone efflux protein [Marinobacter xestospongiae]MDV2080018.1 homoserine/homoserine lactone efflux protein [Marinobacter xestospongiae]